MKIPIQVEVELLMELEDCFPVHVVISPSKVEDIIPEMPYEDSSTLILHCGLKYLIKFYHKHRNGAGTKEGVL